eukprot:3456017-Prymnesium_polylepis.1
MSFCADTCAELSTRAMQSSSPRSDASISLCISVSPHRCACGATRGRVQGHSVVLVRKSPTAYAPKKQTYASQKCARSDQDFATGTAPSCRS